MRLALLALTSVAFVVVACGEKPVARPVVVNPPGGGDGNSTNTPDGGNPQADAGTPDDAGSARLTGYVQVSTTNEAVFMAVQNDWFATARFDAPDAGPRPNPFANCSRSTVGACQSATCTFPDAGVPAQDGGVVVDAVASAGTIDILGGIVAVQLVPQDGGSYPTINGTSSLFNGGETLQITASGGVVPAFTTSLDAPARTVVSTPDGGVQVFRDQPLTLTWTPSSIGELRFSFQTSNASSPFEAPSEIDLVACSFPVSAGTAEIPAEALQTLRAGSGTLSFDRVNEKVLTVGDWDVTVRATASGVGSDDRGLTSITVQ